MDTTLLLKAVADETRLKILTLLLKHNYCVSSLARSLELSEATISQHLKVLREAGLLNGEKRGYFMHYRVERDVLRGLASDIEALAATEHEGCRHEQGGGEPVESERCHEKQCGKEEQTLCHGADNGGHRRGQCGQHGSGKV